MKRNSCICVYVRRGHAITQVVFCWPLTSEAQVQSWSSLCQFCGGLGAIRTSFPVGISVFLFHQCFMLIFHLQTIPIRRISKQNLVTTKQSNAIADVREQWTERYRHSVWYQICSWYDLSVDHTQCMKVFHTGR